MRIVDVGSDFRAVTNTDTLQGLSRAVILSLTPPASAQGRVGDAQSINIAREYRGDEEVSH